MAGIKQFIISIFAFILFSVAILSFGIGFASDNNAAVSLSDDPELSGLSDDLTTDASTLREKSDDTYQSIIESSTEGETTPTGGSFSITGKTLVSSSSNILKVGYVKVFGTGSGFGIFLTGIISIFGILLGIYIWKAWIGRSPD